MKKLQKIHQPWWFMVAPVRLQEVRRHYIKLSKAYGNRLGVLPFTVIVDRKSNIVHRQRTELTYEQVESMIKPLL